MTDTTTDDAKSFADWVILELLGHRRLAGYLTEVQIAGAGFLRIDIPCDPPVTQYAAPASVYAITPTTEDIARALAERLARPAPAHRWELPAAKTDQAGEPLDEYTWNNDTDAAAADGPGPF
jgi:hypothetical protein